jgi:octaprenyl-diphosphate synthase
VKFFKQKKFISLDSNQAQKIKKFVKNDIEEINQLLKSTLVSDSKLTSSIVDHIVNSGGKRIRPVLSILTAKALGYNGPKIYCLASAVELIHTATLLHDDVIDESDKRRGVDTVNNIWDNKSAILAGDFIFAKSFELMVKTNNLTILDNLAKASSIIAEGEIVQLELLKSQEISLSKYLEVISAKTAKLFAEACRNSVILASGSQDLERKLYEFGFNLGVIFQIIDDLLDYFGDGDIIGKSVGDDFFENKITLPVILLHSEMKQDSGVLQKIISKQDKQESDLNQILDLMKQYKIREKSIEYTMTYKESALLRLNALPASESKEILQDILELSLYRLS